MDQDEEDLLSLLATDLDRHFRHLVIHYQQRLYSFGIRLAGSPLLEIEAVAATHR